MIKTQTHDDATYGFSEIAGPIDLTRALISQHTVTSSIDPGFVEKFSGWLTTVGFDVRRISVDGIEHMLATIGPSSPRLRVAFIGHYDTVPFGNGWRHPPLGAHEEDGVIYGRGASDMKSGDSAMIFAALDVAKEGIHSTLFLPGDEETASQGMPALLELVSDNLDLCICGEPTSKSVLGDCLKIGRRGRILGSVTLKGKAGHAAYAEITPNIIEALPAVIKELSAPWNDSCFETATTLAITNLSTDSTASNVIPGTVTLTFDTRFAPDRSSVEIESEIQRRLVASGVPCELNVSKSSPAYLTDIRADSDSKQVRFVECALREIQAVTGKTPKISCDGGASDARYVAARGVPTIEFGVAHGNMHGPDEFVDARSIELLREIYGRIVRAMASESKAWR